ncbi:hypothetical protein GKR19_03240, partial [Staphylococcus aureus]|nr:hypothetical protein [Staphylococcus aureus]
MKYKKFCDDYLGSGQEMEKLVTSAISFSQLLPIETSVRIPQNDISRYVNEIVETIPDSEFDEFRHHRGATSYH